MYDFDSAINRIAELWRIYRSLRNKPADGTWDWWIVNEVNELEKEMAAARENEKATARNSDQFNTQTNFNSPILPQLSVDNHCDTSWLSKSGDKSSIKLKASLNADLLYQESILRGYQ